MQIRTALRYYLMPIRMAVLKMKEIKYVGEDMEKRKNWHGYYEK